MDTQRCLYLRLSGISHMAVVVPIVPRKVSNHDLSPGTFWQSGNRYQGSVGSCCLSLHRMIGTSSGQVILLNIHCDQENQEKCQQLRKGMSLRSIWNWNNLGKLTTNTPPAKKTISKPPEIALPLIIAFWDLQVRKAPITRVQIAAPWQIYDNGFPSTKNPKRVFGWGACWRRLWRISLYLRERIK